MALGQQADVRPSEDSGPDLLTSGLPTIRPEPRAGTSAGWAFQGQVDCLAPGYDGFRAAFQKETKRRADEAQPGTLRRGP